MRWFSLRRAQTEDGTKLRSFRFPNQLSQRLDDRAKLEGKTVTEVVMQALENLLSAPSVSTDESEVIKSARQIKEAESEIGRLQSEQAYVDAKEHLHVINLQPGDRVWGIQWWKGERETAQLVSKDEAEKGVYAYDGTRRRITPSEYDQWVADKAVNEKIVSDYDNRIHVLQTRISSLKAEIVKPGFANSSKNNDI